MNIWLIHCKLWFSKTLENASRTTSNSTTIEPCWKKQKTKKTFELSGVSDSQ